MRVGGTMLMEGDDDDGGSNTCRDDIAGEQFPELDTAPHRGGGGGGIIIYPFLAFDG